MGEGLNHIPEEEIAKIEQQRLENQQRLEQTAREQNAQRPLKDKLLGRNKTTSEDLMLDEAYTENRGFDLLQETIKRVSDDSTQKDLSPSSRLFDRNQRAPHQPR